MCDALVELLGPTLQTKSGTSPTKDALAGKKAVGLYFSAHWCPPCRGFTPKLGEWYTKDLQAKGLEIVFVSSDRDEGSFDSYYGEQAPWLALPYSERKIKDKLSKKFKVNGIPSFVVLDCETGETITMDGREVVSEDPTGKDFPMGWKPPTFWDALGDEFLQGLEGETVSLDEVKSKAKYIGLYFSAHWCPPCRGFTPDLIKAYNDHLKAKGLEVIFVSSDKNPKEFAEYYGTMPWLAIPQGDARKNKLSKVFGVEGIPTFAVVDAVTGEVVNGNARGKVSADPTGASFPWYPPAVNDLSEGEGLEALNEELCLVALLDNGCDEATKAAAKATLTPIAEACKASKDEGGAKAFFMAPTGEGPTGKVRELCAKGLVAAEAGKPVMLLLDIPDEGGYYVSPATEITTETVTGLLEAHKAGALERKQLGEK